MGNGFTDLDVNLDSTIVRNKQIGNSCQDNWNKSIQLSKKKKKVANFSLLLNKSNKKKKKKRDSREGESNSTEKRTIKIVTHDKITHYHKTESRQAAVHTPCLVLP